ncbi:MAG: orotate phosphoribosyltransferase [Sphingobacteriia bacterium]|nr:orotate phosphoribosyltransferase [Sphingobacteriia bacterium]
MNNAQILKEFEDAEAILKGHFILSSGLRSDTYLQCARVLMNPNRAERLCKALAEKIKSQLSNLTIDMVVSPAMGGVVVGFELARQLNVESLFCERVDGVFNLRRGFNIPKGAKILVVEDVVTTGKSSIETFECIKQNGGEVVAEACLIDRSNGKANLGVPLISLMQLEVATYDPNNLPEHLKNIPAIKPGSRPTPAI